MGDPTLLETLLRKCLPQIGYIQVGSWKVLWTGWGSGVDPIIPTGSWMACSSQEGSEPIYVCGQNAGFLSPGDSPETAYRFPSKRYGAEVNRELQTIDEYLEPERRVMCRLLTEWMKAGGQPKWESMSPETRLYTNCDRFMFELTGNKLDGREPDYSTFKRLRRELLNF